LRLLTVYGLGAMTLVAPVRAVVSATPVDLADGVAIAAVASGRDEGFVADREGRVWEVAADGTTTPTGAPVGPYRTPFGTAVGDRAVFGGLRCAGDGCHRRMAEVTVLDDRGRRATVVELTATDGWPSPLDGVALVGHDGDRVWVNAADRLFAVEVPADGGAPRVVEEAPWPGGEPCLIDGVLHDLRADGGGYRRQGVGSRPPAPFRLTLSAWDGEVWHPAPGGPDRLAYGDNALCTRAGYEVRGAGAGPGPGPGSDVVVASSTRRRYALEPGGALVELVPAGRRDTGITIPGIAALSSAAQVGALPPALQVDDAGGALTWCVTADLADIPATTCGVAPPGRHETGRSPGSPTAPAARSVVVGARTPVSDSPTDLQHYNICSAACGPGVRAHTRDLVAALATRHRPAALSLNELCYDDIAQLGSQLPDYRVGAGWVALDRATACPGAVKQFGNHVLVHRGVGPTEGWWTAFRAQSAPCDPADHECRGVACATPVSGSPDVVWCSAHLESPRHGERLPLRQAGEYVVRVGDRYADRTSRVLAGDLNLRREWADLVFEDNGYRSVADDATVGSHDPPASGQIDMVYDDTRRAVGGTGATDGEGPATATYCDAQASDHCHVAVYTPSR